MMPNLERIFIWFKSNFWLILILSLSFGLRVYNLSHVPPGFWFDEASFSYSAYSVLETGKDEFGQFLPLAFKSFGQYNAPLIFYWLIPFIKILGLNVFASRFSCAILGVLTTYGLYLLGAELFKSKKVGLFSALFFAISPFSLQFNRMVHENNLMVFLLVFGVLFLIQGLKSVNKFLLGTIFLGLTYYTYLSARIFTTLFILLFLFVYRDELSKNIRKILLAGITFLIILIPFLWFLTTPAAWPRVNQTSFWSDPGVVLRINEARGKYPTGNITAKLLYNKFTGYTATFIGNYLSHFNPRFLLFDGDPVKIYKTPGVGIMYFWEFGLLSIGIIFLIKNKLQPQGFFIIGWLLLSFLPASLTRFVPSSSRSFQACPVICLISAWGLSSLLQILTKLKHKNILVIFFGLMVVANFIYYLNQYYIYLPKLYAYEWRDGAQAAIEYVKNIDGEYKQIIVDQEGISYVNWLFFLKYPPSEVQKEALLTEPDKFGFSYIPKIGKYYFVKEPPENLNKKELYIGRNWDNLNSGRILSVTKDHNGKNSFFIVSFQK